MRAWVIVLLLPLAGCFGADPPDTVEAHAAVAASQKAVDAEFEYSLFLGVTGTEGPLDWQAYEEDLMQQGGQPARFAETFDQDMDHGRMGDGRLGAWVTTHFAYDEERRLLGGLYTQAMADGSLHRLFAAYTGPYQGTASFASLSPETAAFDETLDWIQAWQREQEDAQVLCALVTHTDDWNLSSSQAAKAALATKAFGEHIKEFPEGELTYYYFPQLDVEEGCPATISTPSNHWIVFHTDLDDYLDGGAMPTVATARIDAASGEVLYVGVEPLALRVPTIIDTVIEATDGVAEGFLVHSLEIPVYGEASRLQLQALRQTSPLLLQADETLLRDPSGVPVDRADFANALHQYLVDDPAAGTWTFEYRYQGVAPGDHVVEVRGSVLYS